MTGSCIFCTVGLYDVSSFFSEFNTLLYKDVSVSSSFLWYVHSDNFSEILFGLTLSSSSGIAFTGILSSGSYVGIMFSSTTGTKSYLCASYNIFRVSTVSVIFQSSHLTYPVIMNLLVSGLYKL